MGIWTTTPRTWVAGEVPTAANFNTDVRDFGRAFADAWTAYTPTLTASTTNPTGWTQTGYYMQAGKLVVCRFRLQAGASMTAGSGTYRVALPVSANTAVIDVPAGPGLYWDASTDTNFLVSCAPGSASYLVLPAHGSTHVTHASPSGGFAVADVILGSAIYEAA